MPMLTSTPGSLPDLAQIPVLHDNPRNKQQPIVKASTLKRYASLDGPKSLPMRVPSFQACY